MSTSRGISLAVVSILAGLAAPSWARPTEPALEDGISADPLTVAPQEVGTVALPALPARPGRVIALRFRAFIVSASPAGCNYNASVLVNGAAVARRSGSGEERLLGREPSLELLGGADRGFAAFSSDRLMMMFAADAAQADGMTADGLGATFVLDISDLASGVDGNSIQFRNHITQRVAEGLGDLKVQDIQVGWLDPASVPKPRSAVPERGAVAESVEDGAMVLRQGKSGGFVLEAGGISVLVETGLGMTPQAPSLLLADDAASPAGALVTSERSGPAGFALRATLEGLEVKRVVTLEEGLLRWRETWINTGTQIRGVPFRHRVFPRQGATGFRLGGSDGCAVLAGCPANPTMFLETGGGNGVGVTAESDWLRLLMGLRYSAGVGELFSTTLALPAGKQVSFDITITPVTDGGGYFSFINGLRRRWGVNGITQPAAVFWGYERPTGEMEETERARKALAHLGPVYVVLGPWQRLEPDARTVTSGRYPKLPAGAPPAPGGCPDLDVDTFLTYEHRERYFEQLKIDVARIRQAAPNAKVMQMLHPSMEVIYKPLAHRWPIANEAILTPEGTPFETAHYSRSWVGTYAEKGWGVYYYVPLPGSTYLSQVLSGARRALDELDLDGIYSDEFSWAGTHRGYSRYDYGRWDGYSADLDDDGNVLRLKSDNGYVTESCQLQMANEVLRRGRYFLANGPNVLRSLNSLPHARFVEGGNGQTTWAQNHLSPTPLVLGNMGDETTLAGVFASVRNCLLDGCLYSPTAVNLLLDGPDNFVCKQYPMTVRELGPGWVAGSERIVSVVSRAFAWGQDGRSALLYTYDAAGPLVSKSPAAAGDDGLLRIEVPEGGMVIAESG